MPKIKLSRTTIDRAAFAGADGAPRSSYYLFDTALPGFAVRISRGTKSYVVRREPFRPLVLGNAAVLPLDEARALARAVLSVMPAPDLHRWHPEVAVDLLGRLQLRGSVNALDVLTALGTGPSRPYTVEQLFERYMADRVDAPDPQLGRPRLKERTRLEYRRIWTANLLPRLRRDTLVSDLTPENLWDLKHAMQDRPVAFNRALQQLQAALRHAGPVTDGGLGWIAANPAAGIHPYTEEPSTQTWTPDTYRRLGDAIRRAWRKAPVPTVMLAAIELVLLHGCRPGEILKARRTWLDLEIPWIHAPEAKGDRPGRRRLGRTIYLSPRGVELIQTHLLPIESPWLVPSPIDPQKHVFRLSDAWSLLRESAGVDVDLRSARSGWRTHAEIAGIPRAAIYRLGDWRGTKIADETYFRPTRAALLTCSAQAARQVEELMQPA